VKYIILTLVLLNFISCGTSKINNEQKISADTFSDETFMRYGHARLKKFNSKDILVSSLVQCYRGNYSKGLKSFQKSLKTNRQNPKYWLYIANCYQMYGNNLKANHFYDYAMSGSSLIKAAIFNNKALMAMKAHNYEDAQSFLQKSISLSSSQKVPKFNLAQLYIKFNQTKKARSLISSYLTNSTNDVVSRMVK
jgi:Tfp pilus assembly protein PilF